MKSLENEQLLAQIQKLQEYHDSKIENIATQYGISFEEAEALQEEHDDYQAMGCSTSYFYRPRATQQDFYYGGSL